MPQQFKASTRVTHSLYPLRVKTSLLLVLLFWAHYCVLGTKWASGHTVCPVIQIAFHRLERLAALSKAYAENKFDFV